MKVKDVIKKQTTIIAVAVILLTVTVIGVSYAVFFDVKASDNQVIKAGTLEVSILNSSTNSEFSNSSAAINIDGPDANGLSSAPVSYKVTNKDSNLPAHYDIYIYPTASNQVPPANIKISRDGDATAGTTAELLTSITDTMTVGNITYYKIDSGDLAKASEGATKYLRIWVDEDTLTSEISNLPLDFELYISSEVDES